MTRISKKQWEAMTRRTPTDAEMNSVSDRRRRWLERHHWFCMSCIKRARRVLLTELLVRGRVTIEDVRRLAPSLPAALWGAAPGPLVRVGAIEKDGESKSTRPEARGRHVSVWRLRDRSTAEQWLAGHADLFDKRFAYRRILRDEACLNRKWQVADPNERQLPLF